MFDNTDTTMIITAASYVVGGALLGVMLRILFGRLAGRGMRDGDRTWGQYGWRLLRGIALPAVTSAGLSAAVRVMEVPPPARDVANRVLLVVVATAIIAAAARVAGSIVGTVALARAGAVRNGTTGRAGTAPAGNTASGGQSATIFVNITRVVVVAVGVLVLLQSLGVSIAPMLTALGVGGLAVALALQDTLANLFAGVQIIASKKVETGDFVRLDSGEEGYVVDVNWRNTSVRQLAGNIVVVPNAKLADSVLTNFHQPMQDMALLVQLGVSYDSDLEHVEQVTIEVGREVMETVDGGVPDHEPFIRYHTFGDSSIQFSVILRASEYTAQFLLQHEFIKRLHRRYRAEGIEIPFPIRTLLTRNGQANQLERTFAMSGAHPAEVGSR